MRISYSNCVNSGGKHHSVSLAFGPDLLVFVIHDVFRMALSCGWQRPGQSLTLELTFHRALTWRPTQSSREDIVRWVNKGPNLTAD